MHETNSLVQTLLGLPVFQSEWVLYLLLLLSVASIAIIIERAVFYRRHAIDSEQVRRDLTRFVDKGDLQGACAMLKRHDSLETNPVFAGLAAHHKGPESVEELITGALGHEKSRYEKRTGFLATVASNAPYIGLFGTVLGIIKSFRDLSVNMADASQSVMAGISEALLATAIGLLVAIPAVIAFNLYKGKIKHAAAECETMARIVLAHLKSAGDESARDAGDGGRSSNASDDNSDGGGRRKGSSK